ncbi:MAG: hypothetical protein LBJ89_00475 [Holosporales bacterium]|nr:hypothetical protein [Holosporales bacterium]
MNKSLITLAMLSFGGITWGVDANMDANSRNADYDSLQKGADALIPRSRTTDDIRHESKLPPVPVKPGAYSEDELQEYSFAEEITAMFFQARGKFEDMVDNLRNAATINDLITVINLFNAEFQDFARLALAENHGVAQTLQAIQQAVDNVLQVLNNTPNPSLDNNKAELITQISAARNLANQIFSDAAASLGDF